MANRFRGRVLQLRERGDGTYAVMFVAAASEGKRHLLWLLSERPLELGALVEFEGSSLQRYNVEAARGPGTVMTCVEGGKMEVIPDAWPRRYVPERIIRACQAHMSRRLYPHQLEAAGWVAERLMQGRGSILGDEQGLGKTLTALSAVVAARRLPVIIVCPATLKTGWKRECSHIRGNLKVGLVDGERGPLPSAHILITNYALLRARYNQLVRLGAKAIVFDEGHQLKEARPTPNHRAAVATRLAQKVGPALLLTGTPMPNAAKELWRLFHVADPQEWGDFAEFRERYCLQPEDNVLEGRRIETSAGRVHNVDELRTRMQRTMLRRLKRQVLPDLPRKSYRKVMCQLPAADRAHYDAAERDIVKWLTSVGGAERASRAKSGMAFVKLGMLRRIAAVGKLRAAIPQFLRSWFRAKRGPLVVFGHHQIVLAGVRRTLKKLGVEYATITNKFTHDKRQAEVDRFNAGAAECFVGPTRAAGVGLNLQTRCSQVLFVEEQWVPAEMMQAEDRVHRLGQDKAVTITHLLATKTIDEHIHEVLRAKQRLIDQLLDNAGDKSDKNAATALVLESMVRAAG